MILEKQKKKTPTKHEMHLVKNVALFVTIVDDGDIQDGGINSFGKLKRHSGSDAVGAVQNQLGNVS